MTGPAPLSSPPRHASFHGEQAAGSVANAINVMISDDSAPIRRHLVRMLARLPYVRVVAETKDVPGTIATVDEARPDVVVLDINMPGGSGIDALKYIKRVHPEVAVIMLTNHVNPFYKEACYKAGASHFFDKSSEFQRVTDVLRAMNDQGA